MKSMKYILIALIAVLAASCSSEHGDIDVDHTATWPLDGQYSISITDEAGTTVVGSTYCYIANTEDSEVNDKIWLRIGNYSTSAANAYSINGKLNCSVPALAFSGTAENLAGNVASSTETFTVTDGIIVLKGATAPSGTICDKISFTYTRTNFPGKTYKVEGYRYTGWEED